MKPELKIMSHVGKWTNVKYTMSNAKSRIKSDKLREDYKAGIITLSNPEMLEEPKQNTEILFKKGV